MTELALLTQSNNLISALYDRASAEVPAEYAERELTAAAWIAKRMLELSELDRKQNQTVQVLLANWLFNGEMGQLWMEHPNHYGTFREFLMDVGTAQQGNQLSSPVISDMCAIAEIITPYCERNGIVVDGYITGELWTRFREVIPALRHAAESNDAAEVNSILTNVRTFQTREALRDMYRQRRAERPATADVMQHNGTAVVVVVVPTTHLPEVRGAIGRVAEWQTIASGEVGSQVAHLNVLTDERLLRRNEQE